MQHRHKLLAIVKNVHAKASKGKGKGGKGRERRPPKMPSEENRCHICNSPDHFARDCPTAESKGKGDKGKGDKGKGKGKFGKVAQETADGPQRISGDSFIRVRQNPNG